MATVDRTEAGPASGVIAVMQRVGAAVGIAIIGSVLFSSLADQDIRGPQDVGPTFVARAAQAMAVRVAFALVACALVFVLPKEVEPERVAPIRVMPEAVGPIERARFIRAVAHASSATPEARTQALGAPRTGGISGSKVAGRTRCSVPEP